MMWSLLNKIMLTLCLLGGLMGFSQSVPISDPALSKYFCDHFTVSMNTDCSLLDTAVLNATFTTPQLVEMNRSGVKNLEEILHFKSADTLFFRFNGLTSFPTDLRGVFPTAALDLTGNSLTEAPTYLVDEKNKHRGGLGFIYLSGNQITELPKEWEGSNKTTQVIDVKNNFLTDVPTFDQYEQLRRLRLSDNFLTFEDLIPLKANPRYDSSLYLFFPQKPFDLFINQLAYSQGDSVLINVDRQLSTNHYYLMKGDAPIDSNRTGAFKIKFWVGEDFGEYSVRIRNDEFLGANDFLESKTYDFKRIPARSQGVFVFSPNNDGVEDDFSVEGEGNMVIVDEFGSQVRSGILPFIWKGDDNQGSPLPPGLYLLKKTNNELLHVFIAF